MRVELWAFRTSCLILSIALFPMPMESQEPDREMVPMEMLRTLSFGLPMGGHRLPEVMVGRIPDRFEELFPIPQDARVVGSLDYAFYSISSVAVPGGAVEAEEAWTLGLRALGWEQYSRPPQRGFVSNPTETDQFCFGDSYMLSLGVEDSPDGGSYIILIPRALGRHSMCDPQSEPTPRRPESPIPVLPPPDGARSEGGGSGGGGDEWRADARIRTELPVSALVSHYSVTLEAEGWIPGERVETDGIALKTFMLSDSEGGEWFAVLSAALPPERELRLMSLRMVLLREAAGGGR